MSTEKANTTTLKTASVSEETTTELSVFTLEPKQQRFINLHMTGQYTLVKLAQLLEVHPNTLHKWLKREDVKLALAEVQKETHSQVHTQLQALTLKATQKLHELIDSPIDAVSLQAVKDVLDRGGHKAKQEIKVEKTVTTIEQQFKELVDSTIVDADFEVIE